MKVSASVAMATDGAAPKIPENRFGSKSSPIAENMATTSPPMTNRNRISPITNTSDATRVPWYGC
jgi:hypothetical protein